MKYQDQFTLALQVACLMQQNQMLKHQNTMLRDLIDRVDSVGDLLWRMDRRHAIPSSPDKAGTRNRTANKRHLARKQSAARKRSGK